MRKRQTVTIRNSFDIIVARMQVRQQARALGLSIQEQACIALATSSLAQALKLGDSKEGHIEIHRSDAEEKASLRVVCTVINDNADKETMATAFTDVRWMVDDLTIEAIDDSQVKVTIFKWAAP